MTGHFNASKMGFKLLVLCSNVTLGLVEFFCLAALPLPGLANAELIIAWLVSFLWRQVHGNC